MVGAAVSAGRRAHEEAPKTRACPKTKKKKDCPAGCIFDKKKKTMSGPSDCCSNNWTDGRTHLTRSWTDGKTHSWTDRVDLSLQYKLVSESWPPKLGHASLVVESKNIRIVLGGTSPRLIQPNSTHAASVVSFRLMFRGVVLLHLLHSIKRYFCCIFFTPTYYIDDRNGNPSDLLICLGSNSSSLVA